MTNNPPKLLDLFCCAGGSAMGYHRAGFDVTGVDINPQPRYPFTFIQGDALEYLAEHGHEYDAIHASPPCQDHSTLSSRTDHHGTEHLLGDTIAALEALDKPHVVENVMGAQMPYDLVLCGSMFGLRVYRHRKFLISMPGLLYLPTHPEHKVLTSTKKRKRDWDAGMNISVTGDIGVTIGRPAMGIPWMNGKELSQAIPPAYTEFIGAQLMNAMVAA
jgi:DNA (cytosine-5)-methyltransferase 1